MKNLQDIRIKNGLTQKELAYLADIPLRTIQHYERCEYNSANIGVYVLLRLAIALNCKLSDLLDDEAKDAAIAVEHSLLVPFS